MFVAVEGVAPLHGCSGSAVFDDTPPCEQLSMLARPLSPLPSPPSSPQRRGSATTTMIDDIYVWSHDRDDEDESGK